MNVKYLLPVVLLGLSGAVKLPFQTPITGDYVEARTASVFAGACHYNGERVTVGNQAVAAWDITAGVWQGTRLAGVKAIASVTADENLGGDNVVRVTELVIDSAATDAQAAAFADWLSTQHKAAFGVVTSIHRQLVSFRHDADGFAVAANHFADLTVHPMPGAACCTQPELVWYSPLMPLDHRKVGYTDSAEYTAGTTGEMWQRTDENSAFYGKF